MKNLSLCWHQFTDCSNFLQNMLLSSLTYIPKHMNIQVDIHSWKECMWYLEEGGRRILGSYCKSYNIAINLNMSLERTLKWAFLYSIQKIPVIVWNCQNLSRTVKSLLPFLQANRVQGNHSLMDASRWPKTPGSETKDIITLDKSQGGNAKGHRRRL